MNKMSIIDMGNTTLLNNALNFSMNYKIYEKKYSK